MPNQSLFDFALSNPLGRAAEERSEAEERAFRALMTLTSRETGVDLSLYKESTLRRQTLRRSRGLGFHRLEDYLAHAEVDPSELGLLQHSFLISVSSFFRDGAVFDALGRSLRTLMAAKRPGDALRVWVPACATGEEAYSIAILLAEILGDRLAQRELRVFASDNYQEALAFARTGIYSVADLAGLDPERRNRWFCPEGHGWRVSKTLRELCVFSAHDLTGHPPFIRMDLVNPFVRTAEVALINFEPILHNPHLFSDKHSLFNIAMPTANREIAATLVRARGVGLRLQCDVHVHMNAWAAALDHPYFAVTDELGRFEIKGIPPGSYTLIAWHPGFHIVKFSASRPVYDEPHVLRQPLEISPEAQVESRFEFPVRPVEVEWKIAGGGDELPPE